MGVTPVTYSSYGPPTGLEAIPIILILHDGQWAMGPPVEYISSIKPSDVLSVGERWMSHKLAVAFAFAFWKLGLSILCQTISSPIIMG
jgi:hypothetical protein